MKGLVRKLFVVLAFAFVVLQLNAEPFVVVIDAGHGGKDVGALGRTVREKDVNLAVALKLGEMITENMNDVKVVYTRDIDKYLTLQERAQIANKVKGNLFISIHTNSLDKKNKNRSTIKGASTYTLGLHRSDDNLEVAMRENSVISLEDNYEATYQGFDPNSSESYIIFEISQSAHMDQSVDFASRVQKEFVSTAGRVDRGVRQAGFLVLAQTSMPSVLVELDFICNPTQENFLGSQSGQYKLAKSIYDAFYGYKMACNNKSEVVTDNVQSTPKVNDEAKIESQSEGKIYKVQFIASADKLSSNDYRLKGLSPVDYYKDGGMYKYTYGAVDSNEEAAKLLKEVKSKFKDAFIVVFDKGKRIK